MKSINRVLDDDTGAAARGSPRDIPEIEIERVFELGVALAARTLWEELGIGAAIRACAERANLTASHETALFARPLACFAGIWTRWTSVRKVKEGETTNDLLAFLTTEPNMLVATYHPKAMPVILTAREEIDLWMTAPPADALTLQRPLPDGVLSVVARGAKEDG